VWQHAASAIDANFLTNCIIPLYRKIHAFKIMLTENNLWGFEDTENSYLHVRIITCRNNACNAVVAQP
jgi:hypothetical protein